MPKLRPVVPPPVLFTTTYRVSAATSEWLATASVSILKHQAKRISRSDILRAVIDGLAAAHFDLSGCSSEDEIKRAVVKQFGANGKVAGKAL